MNGRHRLRPVPSVCFRVQGNGYGGRVTNDPAVKDVPLSGGATLRGAAGTITVQWLTFGSVADAELTTVDMFALPDGPVDPELSGLTGQTLAQVATDLARQGVALRFTGEHRPNHPDALAATVAADAGFSVAAQLTQYRTKLEPGSPPAAEAPAGITVRPIDPEGDREAWARLHRAAYGESFVRCLDTVEGVEARLEQVADSGLEVFVAPDPELPGQLVGAVATATHRSGPNSPIIGEISLLAVDPDWRRRGLGRHLLAEAAAHLAAEGARTGMAYVDEANEAATALFAGAGYKSRAQRTYYA